MSRSDAVDLVDKPDLSDHVTLLQPADLTFSDHVDGTYSLDLEPGLYTVTVSLAEGQQVLRQDVTVDNDGGLTQADFRFASAATTEVAGLEERNPNMVRHPHPSRESQSVGCTGPAG